MTIGTNHRTTAAGPTTALNVERIEAALARSTLCADALIDRDRSTGARLRCGVAALLHAAGVSDIALERLENLGYAGDAQLVWRRYGGLLERVYGFQSPEQLADTMNANDSAVDEGAARTMPVAEASIWRRRRIVEECHAINRERRR